ncbi:MAG: hypothetical protein LBG15_03850 [Dysgonamonadaceae bacterium]|jgi:hypothetical protein|nr:hypothetical protein [Dysgonamonadaceae bacterium]
MIERIKKIMDEARMNPSAFADFIGINRATMIQTLKRNNQVSTNVLIPILTKYPKINPEWLILGKEPMYKDEKAILVNHPANSSVNPVRKEPNIFDANYANSTINPPKKEDPKKIEGKNEELIPKQIKSQAIMPELSLSENIDKIIIFFKNKTFVTLKPEE